MAGLGLTEDGHAVSVVIEQKARNEKAAEQKDRIDPQKDTGRCRWHAKSWREPAAGCSPGAPPLRGAEQAVDAPFAAHQT